MHDDPCAGASLIRTEVDEHPSCFMISLTRTVTMKNQTSMPAAGEWSQLATFRIYKDVFPGHEPIMGVFNNTRQQCIVRILVVGLDSANNEVPIPPADLDKIELIDYVTGTPLTRVDHFDNHPEWAYSTEHQGYEWDESKILDTAHDADSVEHVAGPSSIPRNRHVVYYYVSTRSHSTKQIAARLCKNETCFRTNVNINDPDGNGNGSGSFNSYVEIRPVAFPTLPSENYGDVSGGRLRPIEVGSNIYFYWATEHFLHVKLGDEELRLKSVSGSDVGPTGFSVYKYGGSNDNAKWGISYYGQPGEANPEHFPLEPLESVNVLITDDDDDGIPYRPIDMFRVCVGSIQNATNTRVVIGLLTGNFQGEFRDKNKNNITPVTSTKLHIMDVYGNNHTLSLVFGDKANELIITRL